LAISHQEPDSLEEAFDEIMRLHFLGTASGLPSPVRYSQTTVLERAPDDLYILDVGDGASGRMLRQGLDHNSVRGIVISHMHGDHYCGLVQLLKTMMHLGRRAPLIIYLPSEGIVPLQNLLDASYLIPELLDFPIRWLPIECDSEVNLNPEEDGQAFKVRAFANKHLDHYRAWAQKRGREVPWKYQSYSFHIDAGGPRIGYVGNLHRKLGEVDPEFRGVEALISELAHLRPPECLDALSRLRPRHAFFSHFNMEWDDRANWEKGGFSRLAEGLDGVQVWMTEDGDIYRWDASGGVRLESRE